MLEGFARRRSIGCTQLLLAMLDVSLSDSTDKLFELTNEMNVDHSLIEFAHFHSVSRVAVSLLGSTHLAPEAVTQVVDFFGRANAAKALTASQEAGEQPSLLFSDSEQ